ncbi:MAG: divalent-cation tolerance protein CutA [Promethearchaeota archaeon]|nr:MAG: divalent-cation tolerance protein CutA [Candidatus Lokiarchaeota archaeon]
MKYYLFIVTVNKLEEGKKIAKILIENKVAACVNIIQNVISIYEWKGKIEEDSEYILLIKTTEEKSDLLIQKIQEIHSYETPECIGLRIEKGSKKYLNWIDEVVNK